MNFISRFYNWRRNKYAKNDATLDDDERRILAMVDGEDDVDFSKIYDSDHHSSLEYCPDNLPKLRLDSFEWQQVPPEYAPSNAQMMLYNPPPTGLAAGASQQYNSTPLPRVPNQQYQYNFAFDQRNNVIYVRVTPWEPAVSPTQPKPEPSIKPPTLLDQQQKPLNRQQRRTRYYNKLNRDSVVASLVRSAKIKFGIPTPTEAMRLAVRNYIRKLIKDYSIRDADAFAVIDMATYLTFIPTDREKRVRKLVHTKETRHRLGDMHKTHNDTIGDMISNWFTGRKSRQLTFN
jgi:hypothetical protein